MRDTVDQPANSSDRSAWKNHIKRWGLFILSGEWIWRNDFKSLRVTLAIFAFILFVAILCRGFGGPEANWIDGWLGTSQLEAPKWETIKILGQALLGLGAIIGIYAAYRRASGIEAAAKAQQETAQAQKKTAEAQHKTAQAQHDANEQKMFNDATAKLGDKSASVRLGGIYALDKLAKLHLERSNQDDLASIVEILCAHLRETTQQKDYQENHKNKPSNEIQSLLEVLSGLNKLSEAKQEDEQSKPVHLNLSDAYLVGAHLTNACLNRANLSRADMRGAHLSRAQLQEAVLYRAQLQRADLQWAQMQGAFLYGAQLQEADLECAQLQKADLQWAQMQGAFLYGAQLQGTVLKEAQMQGVNLFGARMQGTVLNGAQMQGTDLWGAQMQGTDLRETQMQGTVLNGAQMQAAYVDRMQVQGAKLREVGLHGASCENPLMLKDLPGRINGRQGMEADLTTVIFSGGLKAEDVQHIREQLAKCQKNGWMTEKVVKEINDILKEHQDKPAVHEPPSGIVETDSYDKEVAGAVIAEYEKAMAGVKEDPSTD